MKDYDPLTAEEVNEASKDFFPLFDIVHRNMPENCTVEDTLKVMESVCKLAHKKRAADEIPTHLLDLTKKMTETQQKQRGSRDE